jgi:hypothetical protein
MTQALVPIASLAEAERFSVTISKSALLPPALRNKPADVLFVVLTGQELGISPLQAIRGISIIQGKPVLDAALIVALCLKHPECKFFALVESTAERAVYETLRTGHPNPTRITWTMEDAKRAKLTGKDNWVNHPSAMLRARCAAALARVVYPDILFGAYVPDEADEFRERHEPRSEPTAIDAVVVDEPASAAAPITSQPPENPDIAHLPDWAGPDDYRELETGASAVTSLDDLKTWWEKAQEARKRGSITSPQLASLAKLKDAHKRVFETESGAGG